MGRKRDKLQKRLGKSLKPCILSLRNFHSFLGMFQALYVPAHSSQALLSNLATRLRPFQTKNPLKINFFDDLTMNNQY